MNNCDIQGLIKWFRSYVADFYTGDPELDHAVRLKELHTQRVREEMVKLAEALELSLQDRRLAEVMALLHDIGRFKQVVEYRTFVDSASVNHALLGLRQLAIHQVLKNCTPEERHLIVKAIAFHNRAALPDGTENRTLFFMRLLRDADKLDIWKVALARYSEQNTSSDHFVDLGLPDNRQCSENVLNSLERYEIVNIQDVKTLNDLKLLQIGWVFDLNYIPSLRAVRERKYVEQIAATLPDIISIQKAVQHVKGYMTAVLKQADKTGSACCPVMMPKQKIRQGRRAH